MIRHKGWDLLRGGTVCPFRGGCSRGETVHGVAPDLPHFQLWFRGIVHPRDFASSRPSLHSQCRRGCKEASGLQLKLDLEFIHEAASTVVIKVKYGDMLRRFNALIVDEELGLSMDGLREKILSLFSFAPDTELMLSYIDEM
ncbi:protein JOKA2 [Sesamum angolense]|uniref:Protein JOKA2 n=1 Tax=Sesamum angolense TaxID=2727404 RepID=A0AAE1WJZ7_9LAMI|nr:protein JOKA2 [Sesamum angolense]